MDEELSWQDLVLIHSRISPNDNGSIDQRNKSNTAPTNGQKWYISVVIGFVFALISSPPAYDITNTMRGTITGVKKKSINCDLGQLTLQTMIFIIIIRIILW